MERYKQGWQLAATVCMGHRHRKCRGSIQHHQRDVAMKLVFSLDGKYTTSVAIRCSICVWDADSGAPVRGPLVSVVQTNGTMT